MSTLSTQVLPAVSKLLQADEDNLYEQLGIRAKALAADASIAGSFDAHVSAETTEMGVMDEVRKLGNRLFRRWNREAHDMLCGTADGAQRDRQEISRALGVDEATVAA